MLKKIQKMLNDLIKYMQKNMLVVISVLIVIAAMCYLCKMRMESFTFKMPILELEQDSRDYGWLCCRSSYRKEPMKMKKCRGGSIEGRTMYYKFMKEEKIITSGLYHDYIVHEPGLLIKFSDGELYKIMNLDPSTKPVSCSIEDISRTYEVAQSDMPVQY